MAVYFLSNDESYTVDAVLPNPPFQPFGDENTALREGHTRSVTGNPKGSKVMEWQSVTSGWIGGPNPPNQTDMFTYLTYDSTPPNGGTLYLAAFMKAIRLGGINIWPDANLSTEGSDKGIELVGPDYRWTLLMGMRNHSGPPGKWNIWASNPVPGHFNPQCEINGNYYNNFGGYGRGFNEGVGCQFATMGDPFYALDYERWYAIVFKVVFSTTATGEIGLWINGSKCLQYTNIITGAGTMSHDRPQLWGTYHQPSYDGPAHKRQLDALVVTDDFQYLVDNGYLQDPASAPPPPPAPTEVVDAIAWVS